MYYLIQSNQNPTIAIKRYHEYLELTASGANGADLSKHIKEHKLCPGGLPWKTILFSIENGKLKEHQKGSYYELPAQSGADCAQLFVHLDNGGGYYKEAKAKINVTQELPLSLLDPMRIANVIGKLESVISFSISEQSPFSSPDWAMRKQELQEVREELKKLIEPRFILDHEICKLVESDATRMEVYDSIEYTRNLYDSIVHELDLVEAWCDTALSGLPGLKTPQNFYVAKSHVED